MDESHKTLIDVQARNVADANRVGRIIYDRDEVRRSLIAGDHPAQVWQPTQRKKLGEGHAGRSKAINIRMSDSARSFAVFIRVSTGTLQRNDDVVAGSPEAQLFELAELRDAALAIADQARNADSPDFDLADAALDAIEDLDLTLSETIATIARSTAPVATSE